MRLLTAISLAFIVLMALACTATTTPTPTVTLASTPTPTIIIPPTATQAIPTLTPKPTHWIQNMAGLNLSVQEPVISESGAYIDIAFEHISSGDTADYKKAIDPLSSAISLIPDWDWFYDLRGTSYYWTAKNTHDSDDKKMYFGKAVSDFTEAINLYKADFYYYWRGMSYYWLEEYERAIEDFSEAIALAPDYDDAYHMRAVVYRVLGRDSEANTDEAKACSLDSQYC